MKIITITLQEDVARWARIWAARHNTSVSRMVGELLRQRMLEEEEGYQAAMQQYLSRGPAGLKKSGSYLEREALHDRESLR